MRCGMRPLHGYRKYLCSGEAANIYSKEIVYNLLIEANGLMINVGINEADLQGEPKVGRRFRGEIWLQGVVTI